VVYGLRVHGFYNTQIVYHFGGIGEQFAYIGSIIAVAVEIELGAYQGEAVLPGGHTGESLSVSDRFGKIFAPALVQEWFIIKKFQLGWSSALEEINDPLYLCGMVRGIHNTFYAL